MSSFPSGNSANSTRWKSPRHRPPRELVIGTIIRKPRDSSATLSPAIFKATLPPGHTIAAMNFLVTPTASGGSRVSTETRVFANSPAARRAFGNYWKVIYPGSALIRRMWLRAINRRATRIAVDL